MKKERKNLISSPLAMDAIRMVWKSKTRFLAILLMTMLSSAVFIGLSCLAPNMRKAVDKPIDELNREHIQVYSMMGLREKDDEILKKLPNVSDYEYFNKGDFYLSGNKDHIIRIQSLTKKMSHPYLTEGRLPQGTNEIILDQKAKDELGLKVGDQITIIPDNEDKEASKTDKITGSESDPADKTDSSKIDSSEDTDFKEPEKPIEDDRLKGESFTITGFCDHVYYLYFKDRGRSLIGDGEVDYFAIVDREAFDKKRPDMVLLSINDLSGLRTSTDKYKELEKANLSELDKAFANRGKEVEDLYNKEVRQDLAEARGKLDDARAKILDAKKELDQGAADLEDARKELDDGWADYRQGQADFNKKMQDGQAELDKAASKLEDAKKKLDDGEAEYASGLEEYNKGLEKVNDGKAQLDEGKQKLDDGQKEIDENKKKLDAVDLSKEDLDKNELKIKLSEEELNRAKAQLDNAEAALPPNYKEIIASGMAPPELKQAAKQIEEGRSRLVSGRGELVRGRQQLAEGRKALEEVEAGRIKLAESQKEIDKGRAEYEESYKEWEKGRDALIPAKEKLDSARAELDKGWKQYNEGREDYQAGLIKLEDGRKEGLSKLANAKKKLDDGEADYNKGCNDYKEGLREYEDEKKKAESDISKAESDINKAEDKLNDLRLPAYKLAGRYNDPYINIGMGNANNMEALTLIFPGVFYLIAMLTTVTTIKRMVDEERTAIGTLKALGLSKYRIANKYLFYAGFSSAIGTAFGILFGFYILMPVIFNAYTKMFDFIFEPKFVLSPGVVLVAFVIGLGLSLISALISFRTVISQRAAELMRPPTPANGHRILMERISPIWKRLNFTAKVTMRNLTAKKSRMFMTLIGVLGSMSLIVMGFGVQHSVASLVDKQFKILQNYDIELVYDSDADEVDLNRLRNYIQDKSKLKTDFYREQATFINKDGVSEDLSLIVVDNAEEFSKLRLLRERNSNKTILPDSDTALLTETFTRALGSKGQDKVMVKNYLGLDHEVPARGSLEQYVGHLMFMTPKLYEASFGKVPNNNAVYMQLKDGTDIDEVISELRSMTAVRYASSNADAEADISDIIDAMGIVVYIIIFISALLSFVVLYNLTNLNISERQRELATIKVLGFHNMELTQYIYRETLMLSLVGIILGIFGGRGLHYAICMALSPPSILIDPAINPASYPVGAGVVLSFSIIVMLIVHRILMKVDMVEALKADE